MHPLIALSALPLAASVLLTGSHGPYSVSMSVKKLTDKSRVDPYAPSDAPHNRNVLITQFMPVNTTTAACSEQTIPYMTPAVAADYGIFATSLGASNETFAVLEMNICQPVSRCRCGCSDTNQQSYPLVLFSPGFGQSRLLYGIMAQSLASHGYAVVTVDHPYDASVVEFPDGTIVKGSDISEDDAALEQMLRVRAADMSFVIDSLKESLRSGSHPKNRKLAIDFDRIIMFGHSLGGATAAQTMLSDPRISGGINMDGRFFNPALKKGLKKPFILMGRPNHAGEDETWPQYWSKLRGPRVHLTVSGTTHGSFTDFPHVVDSLNLPEEQRQAIGTYLGDIRGTRMDAVIASVITAFSDLVFEKSAPSLFRNGSSEVPEIEIVAATM